MQNSRPSDGAKRPCVCLHHDLGDVPECLVLDDPAGFDPVELVKAHVGQVPRGRGVQKRRDEGAHEVAAAADPVGTMFVVAGHHDPVPALHVRPGRSQHGKRSFVERFRSDHVAEGVGKVEDRIRRDETPQRAA